VPHRRCVGCGRIAPKAELLRIAAVGEREGRSSRAVLDSAGTLPGRGAYLCRGERVGEATGEPAVECLASAVRRGGLARALRCAVTLTLDEPGSSLEGQPKLVESVSR
jgi:predicted RNA-binding protein YlxR (DUF448 family)